MDTNFGRREGPTGGRRSGLRVTRACRLRSKVVYNMGKVEACGLRMLYKGTGVDEDGVVHTVQPPCNVDMKTTSSPSCST